MKDILVRSTASLFIHHHSNDATIRHRIGYDAGRRSCQQGAHDFAALVTQFPLFSIPSFVEFTILALQVRSLALLQGGVVFFVLSLGIYVATM
jgi:hypothetical protein